MACHDNWSGCALDPGGRVSLNQILRSFSAPISEEHAWALIHQALLCLSRLLEDLTQNEVIYLVTSTSHILLSCEGSVDRNTFVEAAKHSGRKRAASEKKTVAELGMVVFNALDFSVKDDDERQLSPALENLIDIMTASDAESGDEEEESYSDDEGIEKDHEDAKGGCGEKIEMSTSGTCQRIIELCRNHLALPTEAESHFRAVCRALVSEALELSSFMEKVSLSKREIQSDSELNELKLQDWARLWVQVIHELRTGIKLKKTDYSKTPIEYELTPYEILMDDIRSRRYKLNKVMAEDRLRPEMKRDAHDIILDFIRSRPPLRPAGERKLCAVPRKQSTPVELLMESIRSESSRSRLRKTAGPPLKPLVISSIESSRCKLEDWEPSPLPTRKVIQPDQDLMDSLLNFSDDEDDDNCEDAEVTEESEKIEVATNWHKKLALDLILHGPRLTYQRRHSVSVCQTPQRPSTLGPLRQQSLDSRAGGGGQARVRAKHPVSTRPSQPLDTRPAGSLARQTGPTRPMVGPARQLSLDSRRPRLHSGSRRTRISVDMEELASPTSTDSLSSSLSDLWHEEEEEGEEVMTSSYNLNTPQMHASLHSEFLHSEHWVTALQTLELSMEEVVHIRSVLTRAELEALPLDNHLKEDVAKGKVCFLCMRTRFTLFNWGVRCALCCRQVCAKCSGRMRIPLEHFSAVPVYALSPPPPTTVLLSSPSPIDGQPRRSSCSSPAALKPRDRLSCVLPPSVASAVAGSRTSAGSAPTSPAARRRSEIQATAERPSDGATQAGPTSLPVFTSQGPSTISARFGELRKVLSRDGRGRRESLEGTPLTVCHDCKEMVLQVVRSQKTARRLQLARSLYLSLSPTYKQEIY